jgi:hypothetical protein
MQGKYMYILRRASNFEGSLPLPEVTLEKFIEAC